MQEFAGLIRDAYTTGERSRIICTQQCAHATHRLHDVCAKEEVSSIVTLYHRGLGRRDNEVIDSVYAGELQHTLMADKLNAWIKRTDNQVLAAGYFELDKWMSAMVGEVCSWR